MRHIFMVVMYVPHCALGSSRPCSPCLIWLPPVASAVTGLQSRPLTVRVRLRSPQAYPPKHAPAQFLLLVAEACRGGGVGVAAVVGASKKAAAAGACPQAPRKPPVEMRREACCQAASDKGSPRLSRGKKAPAHRSSGGRASCKASGVTRMLWATSQYEKQWRS